MRVLEYDSETADEVAIRDYLLKTAAPNESLSSERYQRLHEAARSVASHYSVRKEQGAANEDLHFLYARALWGAGESELAREWLSQTVRPRSAQVTAIALLEAGVLEPLLWSAAAMGVLRFQADWVSVNTRGLWRLDLARVTDWTREIELVRSEALRRVVLLLLPVWDSSDGQGALGLKMVDARWAVDEMSWCEAILIKEGRSRNWTHVPDLVRLS